MTYQGIDTAARITAAQARKLKQEGITFIGRYLGSPTLGKTITAQETGDLRAAGLALLLFYEINGTEARTGAAAGRAHGADARKWAEALAVPAGTVIYFAVDFPPTAAEMDAIAAYLKATALQLGPYRCGVYGCFDLVEEMARRGVAVRICQCVAWSYGKESPHADVFQYAWQDAAAAKALAEKTGLAAVDLDRGTDLRTAGLWLPDAPKEYPEDDGGVIIEPQPQPKPAPEPWYAEAMAWAEVNGLIKDGRPRDNVTRAELATVLQRFDKLIDAKIKLHLPADDSAGGLISD